MSDSLRKIAKSKKFYGAVSVLTGCSLVLYEKHKINQFLSKLVNPSVLDVEKKRPDYIYIKYHIYRESMRKLQLKQEQDKNWINVIINPVGKWWKSFKHSVAWRLLNIAQNGNQHERLKAIQQLSMIDHLKDWDFRHLAQICDARTAISLARSGCDTRWFMPVHMKGVIKNPKYALADLHKMLEDLQPHECVKHFLKKYFPATDPHGDDIDEFIQQGHSLSVQDTDLLKEIIAFLHHITKDETISMKLIKEGGLMHLMELKKIFANDSETLSTLCKVLANMSMSSEAVQDFFSSGWIGVLAEWQRGHDIRLQVTAAKCLANLDHDDPNYTQYPPNVYPLHPLLRTRSKPKADVIFIHGLLGGVFITWRQKDRVPTELGLYGKNAFYTNEVDDVFLVGESKRMMNGKKNDKPKKVVATAPVEPVSGLLSQTKHTDKELEISDEATKELVEELRSSAELSPDWEVVHPDIPLKANEDCQGEFSVNGSEWINQDKDEYTNCWPMEWLPEDHPNMRILGIDYTSAVTEWSANFTKYCPCEKGQGHFDVRSTSLLERISRSDVGKDRPIVWIGHSMGGILTKLMLMKALDSPDPRVRQIADSTRGIVFLGTPHKGSPIAKWKQHMQVILSPSIEVKEMEEGAPKLLELHNRFMHCLKTCFRHVNIVSIAEGTPTMLTSFKFPLRIVTEESAHIDHGDFYILKDDHLSLSKPIFRQSFLYQRLLRVIEESVESKEPNETEKEEEEVVPMKQSFTAPAVQSVSSSVWSVIPMFFIKFIA